MTAIPRVKPSITGQGMNDTARPSRSSPGDQHHDAGEHAHDRDRAHAVRGDDRGEDDDHRAGRPRHLHVGSAEHRSDDAGDDRGDEPGLGARARGDAEAEGERQRDDSDGEPGEQIAAPACAATAGSRRPAGSRARDVLARAGSRARSERGQGCGIRHAFSVGGHDSQQQPAGDREQLGDLRVGEPVVDVARRAARTRRDGAAAARRGAARGGMPRARSRPAVRRPIARAPSRAARGCGCGAGATAP